MSDGHGQSSGGTPPGSGGRVHERIAADYRVTVRCPSWDTVRKTIAENVSQGGMFLPTSSVAPLGSIVEITLLLPNQQEVHLNGTVMHVITTERAAMLGRSPGLGISITNMPDVVQALAELQATQPKTSPGPSSHAPTGIGPEARKIPQFSSSPLAPIVGMDFGVSYSGISVAVGDTVYMVPGALNRTLCPSVVTFPEGAAPIVGWSARQALASEPQRTVPSIKRILGYRYSDERIGGYLQNALYPTCAGPNDSIMLQIDAERLAVPQVCALIIRGVCMAVEQQLRRRLQKVVLTYPVAFDRAQQEALILAARLAGLEVVALLHEPVAAALAYGHGTSKQEMVAVYDFGGGTFDFTLLEMAGGRYRVLTSKGDAWLGGDDFDQVVAEAVANAFWRQTRIELRHRAVEWQRLLMACEEAKRQLTESNQTTISLPGIVQAPRSIDFQQSLDRQTFQRLCSPLFERSLDACREALSETGLSPERIDAVVISGGTSRIPFVREGLEQFFRRPITPSISLDEAVALGAGVFAARLARHPARGARSY